MTKGTKVLRKCSHCRFTFQREELNGRPTATGYERYQCPRCGEVVFAGDPIETAIGTATSQGEEKPNALKDKKDIYE